MKKLLLLLLLFGAKSMAQTVYNEYSYMSPFAGGEIQVTKNKTISTAIYYYNYYDDSNPFRDRARFVTDYFPVGSGVGFRWWLSKSKNEDLAFSVAFQIKRTYSSGHQNSGYINYVEFFIEGEDSPRRYNATKTRGGVYKLDISEAELRRFNGKKVYFKVQGKKSTGYVNEDFYYYEETFKNFDLAITTVRDGKLPDSATPESTPEVPVAPIETPFDLGWTSANPFDLEYYVKTFLKDARKSGLVLNPGPINISFAQLPSTTIARAGKTNLYGVLIEVDPENWNNASAAMRWYIMYHELGHDVLNLLHGSGGPLMRPTAPRTITYGQLIDYKNQMFNYKK